MTKNFLIFLLGILFCCISCTEEEENIPESTLQPDRIEITSFKILENSETGTRTEANVIAEGSNPITISDHGVIVTKETQVVSEVSLGALDSNSFEAFVGPGLEKGEDYDIFPYIFAKNRRFYGDTLNFVSSYALAVEIFDFSPKEGFVNDTITITGQNFCATTPSFRNIFLLDESFQNVVVESDSIIKAVVTPNLTASTLIPSMETCGMREALDGNFTINQPVLDSIYPKEIFAGERFFVFGKNLHANISKFWIGEEEINIIGHSRIDTLEMVLPKEIPVGLQDIRLEVLDRVIEQPDYFQSTTPSVTELDKYTTGFLDTLTIRGDYLIQGNSPLEVLVGEQPQQIIDASRTEVKIVIDRYFEVNNPRLVLKTGCFEFTEPITMLPPEIIGFDKEKYHLEDDVVAVQTRYFLGFENNVKVGGVGLFPSFDLDPVDEQGVLRLNLTEWLEASGSFPKFVFDDIGQLKVDLTTTYGSVSSNFDVFAPNVIEIEENVVFHTQSIVLRGTDFGYTGVSKIFVDDVVVPDPGLSTFTLSNKRISFVPPSNLQPGSHTIQIETGGQLSSEISFDLAAVTVSNIAPNMGTRRNIYSLTGTNLDQRSTYRIRLNGFICEEVAHSPTEVQFKLPFFLPLENNAAIELQYGDQLIDAGTIAGIEPFEPLESYIHEPNLFKSSASFEYNGKLYGINRLGIYEFNTASLTWSAFELNLPDFENYFFRDHHVSVVNDKVYVYYANGFRIYDMLNRTWEEISLVLEDNLNVHRAVVVGTKAYLFMKRPENSSFLMFYNYDLETDTYALADQVNFATPLAQLSANRLYANANKIYLDAFSENIMVYDTQNDTWEDIGFPKGAFKTHYRNNLYVYNNVLYFSGGRGNTPPEPNVYAYDLNLKVWKERTPMLVKLLDHTVFGEGGQLYFGLGSGEFGNDNVQMMRYTIATDPD